MHLTERLLSILFMFKHFDYITFIGEPRTVIATNHLCRWSSKLYCGRFAIHKCYDHVRDTGKTMGYHKGGFHIEILIC